MRCGASVCRGLRESASLRGKHAHGGAVQSNIRTPDRGAISEPKFSFAGLANINNEENLTYILQNAH